MNRKIYPQRQTEEESEEEFIKIKINQKWGGDLYMA